MNNDLEFSFGIQALKLLGKNLYSNPISAISELVANGLDANANDIWVYIDMQNKESSVIEILDNGIGMSSPEIKNKYCKIGFNKRKDEDLKKNNIDKNKMMGRKGIGKLAALYLSDSYFISSKKMNQDINTWKVDLNLYDDSRDDKPKLIYYQKELNSENFLQLKSIEKGTLIRIEKVNLKGFADSKLEALEWELSNYFALEKFSNQKIWIKLIKNNDDLKSNYREIKKNIPFKQMICVINSYNENDEFYQKNLKSLPQNKIPFQSKKLDKNTDVKESFDFPCELYSFDDIAKEQPLEIKGELPLKSKLTGEDIKVPFSLEGWVGVHASITGDKTTVENKGKNRFYDLNQIRLYVRNKLAIKNLMPYIKNTQVFSKYIEGELYFDILDDDNFADIATSNRQDMDVNDERFIKLKSIVSIIVQFLVGKRQDIANKVTETENKVSNQIANNNKTELIKKAKENLFSSDYINFLTSNIKGEIIKTGARIFISHSSEDKKISNWVYNSLLFLGVKNEEIFYTSSHKTPYSEKEEQESIINAMKDNITDKATLMFYCVNEKFLCSIFSLFESGAGWISKNNNEYIILTYDRNVIKTKLEIIYYGQNVYQYLSKGKNIKIDDAEKYNKIIVSMFNRCLRHLNTKRNSKLVLLNEIDHIKDANVNLINLWDEFFK